MARTRPWWIAMLMPLLIGIIGLNTVMQRPRFAQIQTVDVVQLVGCGMCFGVALMAFVSWLREKRGSAA